MDLNKRLSSIWLGGEGGSESKVHVAALSEPFPWDFPRVFPLLLLSRLQAFQDRF